MEEKCPCENCICIAICHSKEYINLVDDCSLITKYLIDPCNMITRPLERLKKVKELLNPTFWDYKTDNQRNGDEYSWVECNIEKVRLMKGKK